MSREIRVLKVEGEKNKSMSTGKQINMNPKMKVYELILCKYELLKYS